MYARFPPSRKTLAVAVAIGLALILVAVLWRLGSRPAAPSLDNAVEFKAPPRTPDLSGAITDRLATVQPPGATAPGITPAAAPSIPGVAASSALAAGVLPADDPVMTHLGRYGTPVTKQSLPVGGLTQWTVISKSGRTVQLYTTADGQAVMSGVIWNLATGQNVSDHVAAPTFQPNGQVANAGPTVVAPPGAPPSNLVSGRGALPAAFDGKAPADIPEAIKTVDSLAGYTEGKGGMGDTLYIIIDPRCPYCRRAFQNTREHVKNGATIKWIPTAALGDPGRGVPLATTVLRSKDAAVMNRLLGQHEEIATSPTPKEAQELQRNLDFMFDAFRQNNEPNPGVPVAFFIDRRTGKPRMMMGVSESVVIEDILGQPKKAQ